MSRKVVDDVDVDIQLDPQLGDGQYYSSNDIVSGNVVLKFRKALLVSNVIITFEGSSFTW